MFCDTKDRDYFRKQHQKLNILIEAQFVLFNEGTKSLDVIFILDTETRVIAQYRRL